MFKLTAEERLSVFAWRRGLTWQLETGVVVGYSQPLLCKVPPHYFPCVVCVTASLPEADWWVGWASLKKGAGYPTRTGLRRVIVWLLILFGHCHLGSLCISSRVLLG